MNHMKNVEKIVWIGAIIIASGCMHAAISHYYYVSAVALAKEDHKLERRALEQQFVKQLMVNELVEELYDKNDNNYQEPELIIEIGAQEEVIIPANPVVAKAMADKKSMIVIETQEALQDLLMNNQEPSVIFFHMNGCGWCTKMKPVFDAVVENPEFVNIQFYSVNGPEFQAQDILKEAIDVKVTGYPLFIGMNNGKFIDKQVGGSSPEVFEHKIKSMFPEIFGVIAPLPKPKQVAPAPVIPFSQSITVIENEEALKDLLTNKQEPSVIFFHMTGCGWCTKMRPVFNAAAENPAFANIKFYSVNGPQLNVQNILKETTDQSVTGYPLFICMNNGKYVDKQVGGANPENFENKIKATFPDVA